MGGGPATTPVNQLFPVRHGTAGLGGQAAVQLPYLDDGLMCPCLGAGEILADLIRLALAHAAWRQLSRRQAPCTGAPAWYAGGSFIVRPLRAGEPAVRPGNPCCSPSSWLRVRHLAAPSQKPSASSPIARSLHRARTELRPIVAPRKQEQGPPPPPSRCLPVVRWRSGSRKRPAIGTLCTAS